MGVDIKLPPPRGCYDITPVEFVQLFRQVKRYEFGKDEAGVRWKEM